MTETPKETIWIFKPHVKNHYSLVLDKQVDTVDMVEISTPGDGPQALVHIDSIDGDIWHKLHKGRTVTVKLIDISQED